MNYFARLASLILRTLWRPFVPKVREILVADLADFRRQLAQEVAKEVAALFLAGKLKAPGVPQDGPTPVA